jgi:hypothetical protein
MALYRMVASGTTPGETFSFTLHAEGNLSTADAATAFGDALTAAWAGGMDDLTTADIDLTLASVATLDPATDGQVTRAEVVLALTGVASGEMLPFQCATVISLLTNSATRHGRGRFYLPPLAVSATDQGRVSAAAMIVLDTAWTAFFDSLNTDGVTPVVRNRTGHVSTTVTSARVGNVIDTQRRRRNKLTEVYTVIAVP